MEKNILFYLKKILCSDGDLRHSTKVFLDYSHTSCIQEIKLNKNWVCSVTFLLLLFGNASWAQPSIDGLPTEWPAAFNGGGVIAKSFVRDADNSNDSQFHTGSHDPDPISGTGGWTWSLGSTNNKGNISNAGAIFIGDRIYFFGDRTAINGDASIGFWFFQNGGAPLPNGTFSGSHVIGDILVVSDFTNGGGVSTIKVYRWNGSGVTLIGTTLDARVNSAPIAVPIYTNPDNGHQWSYDTPAVLNYPTGAFFEGFIDLGDLGITTRCFTNFLLETRNSQTINASLQDFVGDDFDVRPDPPTSSDVSRCGPGVVTLTSDCTGTVTRWYETAASASPIAGTSGNSYSPNVSVSRSYWVSCYRDLGDGFSCESTRTEVKVTIDPSVTAGTGSTDRQCLTGASVCVNLFNLLLNEDAGGSWSQVSGPANAPATPNNQCLTADGVYVYRYTVTPPAGSVCPPDSEDVTITIDDPVTAGTGSTDRQCLTGASVCVNLFNLLLNEDAGGSWSQVSGPANAPATPNNQCLTADGVYVYRYTVTPPAGSVCPPDSEDVTITIDGTVTAGAGSSDRQCLSGASVCKNLFDMLTGENAGGSWSQISGPANVVATPNNHCLTEIGVYVYRYTVTPVEGSLCPPDSEDVTITIDDTVTAGSGSPAAYCIGNQALSLIDLFARLTGEDSGGIWTLNSNEVLSPIDLSSYLAGNYIFTYTITPTQGSTCLPDDESVTITISPLPGANCAPKTFNVDCPAGLNLAQLNAAYNASFDAWYTTDFIVLNPALNPSSPLYNSDLSYSTVPSLAMLNAMILDVLNPSPIPVTFTIRNNATECESSCQSSFLFNNICVLSCNATPTNYVCFGESGKITVNGSGGTAPYTLKVYQLIGGVYTELIGIGSPFTFNTSAFTTDINNLLAGNYKTVVTDALNIPGEDCIRNNISITGPLTALDLVSLTPHNANCAGGVGTIDAVISGGTPPYSIKLDGGTPVLLAIDATTYTFTGVTAGQHTVTVYDANFVVTSHEAGCSDSGNVTLTPPPVLSCNLTQPTIVGCATSGNIVNGTVSGGVGPYTCSASFDAAGLGAGWSANCSINGDAIMVTYTAGGVASTVLSVEVTDANGCKSSCKVTLTCDGGKACTPGFWKNHKDLWDEETDYTVHNMPGELTDAVTPGGTFIASTNFNAYFGTTSFPDGLTMLGAASLGGGNCKALARHGVSALLGAAAFPDDYPFDAAGVDNFEQLYNLIKGSLNGTLGYPSCNSLATTLANINELDGPFCGALSQLPNVRIEEIYSQVESQMFTIYPVPFKDNFTIVYEFDYKTDVLIQVFDARGRLLLNTTDKDVYKGKEMKIDFPLTHQKGEIFFIHIETNKGHFVKNISSSTN